MGVAIDWRSNLIYFTDQRTEGYVGVASCDGNYQRIFKYLDDVLDAGPIVVDPLHG